MKPETIVKLTNRVALFSFGLLAYWVFIFICITVFDFKIFRENITETFYLSVLGIFLLLGAAIILNIMFNMTRIVDSRSGETDNSETDKKLGKNFLVISLLIFPLLFSLLFLGDIISANKKKDDLIASAANLISENQDSVNDLINYNFTKQYIEQTAEHLGVISKIEESFPRIIVIVRDEIRDKSVFLSFGSYSKLDKDEKIKKHNYIYSTSKEEREYLSKIFEKKLKTTKFSANDGKYELYYPVKSGDKIIVMYLSQRNNYGKIGS